MHRRKQSELQGKNLMPLNASRFQCRSKKTPLQTPSQGKSNHKSKLHDAQLNELKN